MAIGSRTRILTERANVEIGQVISLQIQSFQFSEFELMIRSVLKEGTQCLSIHFVIYVICNIINYSYNLSSPDCCGNYVS